MKFTEKDFSDSFINQLLLGFKVLGQMVETVFYSPDLDLLFWLMLFQVMITIALTYSFSPNNVRYTF